MTTITQNPTTQTFGRVAPGTPIGEVASLQQKAPKLVQQLGAETPVEVAQAMFGGEVTVSQIAQMPAATRQLYVNRAMDRLGIEHQATRASMLTALYGTLGARVLSSDDYSISIGGQDLDRGIVKGYVLSAGSPGGPEISAAKAKALIVPQIEDGRGGVKELTEKEARTIAWCQMHFKSAGKEVRDTVLPVMQQLSGAPLSAIGDRKIGFEYMALSEYLDKNDRLMDLYAAKTMMTREDMMTMWDSGLGIERFNELLQEGLKKRSDEEIVQTFGADTVYEVAAWLGQKGDLETLQALENGELSFGAFQNLVYGSWQMEGTPYDPNWDGAFRPVPVGSKGRSQNVDTFLEDLCKALVKNDLRSALKAFDPENRQMQREIGIRSDAQYLLEGIGLHRYGDPMNQTRTPKQIIEAITDLAFDSEPVSVGDVRVYAGTATFQGGETRDVNIFVEKTPEGRYEVVPAVG